MAFKNPLSLLLLAIVALTLNNTVIDAIPTFPTSCTCHKGPVRTRITCNKGVFDGCNWAHANHAQYKEFISRCIQQNCLPYLHQLKRC